MSATPTVDKFFTLAPTDATGLRKATDLPWPLPYHLKEQDVLRVVDDLHRLLHDLNTQLDARGYEPMERLLDSAGFSGLISRATADRLARASTALVLNQYHNGYPDLLPRGAYANDSVQHGTVGGLEVKASRYETGWQAHGQRAGWFVVVQFNIDLEEVVAARNREPTKMRGVYVAELQADDWSWQPAAAGKIRSGTASIKPSGMEKLRSGAVWVDPAYEQTHQDRLQRLRVTLFAGDRADAAVVAALTAAGVALHPSAIAAAIAPVIGVTNPVKLENRVRQACGRLLAAGTVQRVRVGRSYSFSV